MIEAQDWVIRAVTEWYTALRKIPREYQKAFSFEGPAWVSEEETRGSSRNMERETAVEAEGSQSSPRYEQEIRRVAGSTGIARQIQGDESRPRKQLLPCEESSQQKLC